MPKYKLTTDLIDGMANDLIHFAPLPNTTSLQKIINNLYIKLRLYGMPQELVNEMITELLIKNNITKEQLYYV